MEKCMRKAIVFMLNSAIRESFNLYFSAVSASIGGDWALGYNSLEF